MILSHSHSPNSVVELELTIQIIMVVVWWKVILRDEDRDRERKNLTKRPYSNFNGFLTAEPYPEIRVWVWDLCNTFMEVKYNRDQNFTHIFMYI